MELSGIDLYNTAKEAYYNGQPIMEDYEFDELEESLGLSNKSYIGAHRNSKYTIQHPYIMGSLSKIQIKETDGKVDWKTYLQVLHSYTKEIGRRLIITPKYDGCSFEAYVKDNRLESISTRGNGEQGVDVRKHLESKLGIGTRNMINHPEYTLRGEVLIDKDLFITKYSGEFTNPRSFVSGLLNRDYVDDSKMREMLDDLSIVIYDTRVKTKDNWIDIDWTKFLDGHLGMITDHPEFYIDNITIDFADDLIRVYKDFDEYRSQCKFALDGIVIKPTDRKNNTTSPRPSDCVAIKFKPMMMETEVIDIEWKSVKTNELQPVLIYKTINLDGKKLNRVRGNNYGWLIENQISIGTKIIISLAGDIIPYIYKVSDTSKFNPHDMQLPDVDCYIDGIHLYHNLSENELSEKRFFNSCIAVRIPKLGPATANQILEYYRANPYTETNEFFDDEPQSCPDNFLLLSYSDVRAALGTGLTADVIISGYVKFEKNATLEDYIIACGFEDCGGKTAAACAKYLMFEELDFESMSEKAYSWCLDPNSEKSIYLKRILEFHHKSIKSFAKKAQEKRIEERRENKKTIPVILTGEPLNYDSKQDFLDKNPQYFVTGAWKKVKMVFTNSMESNTAKMHKARKLGIPIYLY